MFSFSRTLLLLLLALLSRPLAAAPVPTQGVFVPNSFLRRPPKSYEQTIVTTSAFSLLSMHQAAVADLLTAKKFWGEQAKR